MTTYHADTISAMKEKRLPKYFIVVLWYVNLKGNFSVNRLAQNDYLKFLRKKLNVQTERCKIQPYR